MLKHALLSSSIIIFLLQPLFSQTIDFDHYTPLQSRGTVPEDFLLLSSEKYTAGQQKIDQSQSRKVRKTQDQFYLKSSFLINKMLFSGNVLFGDTVTEFLNRVKDIALKSDPGLRDQLRVYLLRSEEVNAFTADNGIIVVTTGLIAHLENEAQLAFILCHESTHFAKQHAVNSYVEEDKMFSRKGIYKNLRRDELELSRFQYSKELESEADVNGFALFRKSGYDISQAISALTMLSYADYPVNNIEFAKNYFNEARYAIPGSYFPDSIPPLEIDENYDDAKSTHPNIAKRKTDIQASMNNISITDSLLFISGENYFDYVRKICRFELCELYINHLEYEEAIYHIYLLQQEENNNYLEKSMAKALYGLSIYRTNDKSTNSDKNSEDVDGNEKSVYYFAEVIPARELNVLALKYAWELHLKQPEDLYLSNICNHLTYTLIDNNKTALSDFKTSRQIMMDSVKQADEKTDSLPIETNTHKFAASLKTKSPYWAYAFAEYMSDSAFCEMFTEEADRKEEIESEKEEDEEEDASLAMGTKHLLIVNPFYYIYHNNRNARIEFLESETAQIGLRSQINDCTDKLDLETNYLDPNFLNESEVRQLNDLAILNAWLMEKISHDEDEVEMINSVSDAYQQLALSYEADHIIWLGYLNYYDPIHYLGGKILLSFFSGLGLPFLVYDLIRVHYVTTIFILAADGNTGNTSIEYYKQSKATDSDSFIKSQLYYLFHEMKKPEAQ